MLDLSCRWSRKLRPEERMLMYRRSSFVVLVALVVAGCEQPTAPEGQQLEERSASVTNPRCTAGPLPPPGMTNTGIVHVFNSTCDVVFVISTEVQGVGRRAIQPQVHGTFQTTASNPTILSTCVSPVLNPLPGAVLRCFNGVRGAPTSVAVPIPLIIYSGPPSLQWATPARPYVRGAPGYVVKQPVRRIQPTLAWPARIVSQ